MNRDDILRMAREAGFMIDEKAQQHQPNCIFHTDYMVDELLERFAALVAAAERDANLQQIEIIVEAALAKERDLIARSFETLSDDLSDYFDVRWMREFAEAIRARGNG